MFLQIHAENSWFLKTTSKKLYEISKGDLTFWNILISYGKSS